jgi:hypothetical protein
MIVIILENIFNLEKLLHPEKPLFLGKWYYQEPFFIWKSFAKFLERK